MKNAQNTPATVYTLTTTFKACKKTAPEVTTSTRLDWIESWQRVALRRPFVVSAVITVDGMPIESAPEVREAEKAEPSAGITTEKVKAARARMYATAEAHEQSVRDLNPELPLEDWNRQLEQSAALGEAERTAQKEYRAMIQVWALTASIVDAVLMDVSLRPRKFWKRAAELYYLGFPLEGGGGRILTEKEEMLADRVLNARMSQGSLTEAQIAEFKAMEAAK